MPITPGSCSRYALNARAASAFSVVQLWPVGGTYCRSSSQIAQCAGGFSLGAYCVPQAVQMKASMGRAPSCAVTLTHSVRKIKSACGRRPAYPSARTIRRVIGRSEAGAERTVQAAEHANGPGRWPEVLAVFFRLGLTSFGGPVAH